MKTDYLNIRPTYRLLCLGVGQPATSPGVREVKGMVVVPVLSSALRDEGVSVTSLHNDVWYQGISLPLPPSPIHTRKTHLP